MEKRNIVITLISALVLGAGIAAGGYFVGNMMYKAKVATNIASVRGLAEREVKANVGVWNVSFEAKEVTLATAYESANKSRDTVVAFLKEVGFKAEEITPSALTVNKEESRDNNGKVTDTSYRVYGSVSVRSEDVDKISAATQSASDLIGKGVVLTSSYPQYLYTKLNDIKPEMLGEATRNARVAAEQFAKDANAKVGNINSASQGFFTVAARDAGGEDGTGDEAASIFKKVRVVTTISFYLN